MRSRVLRAVLLVLPLLAAAGARAEDGYELWLRYRPVSDPALLKSYRAAIAGLAVEGSTPTLQAAREEAVRGLRGLLGTEVPLVTAATRHGLLVAGTPSHSSLVAGADIGADLGRIGPEGFVIRSTRVSGKRATVITGNTDVGVLYGVFRFLQRLQARQPIEDLSIVEAPRARLRVLDH